MLNRTLFVMTKHNMQKFWGKPFFFFQSTKTIHKMLNRTLFVMTKHNMKIFGVSLFFNLQKQHIKC